MEHSLTLSHLCCTNHFMSYFNVLKLHSKTWNIHQNITKKHKGHYIIFMLYFYLKVLCKFDYKDSKWKTCNHWPFCKSGGKRFHPESCSVWWGFLVDILRGQSTECCSQKNLKHKKFIGGLCRFLKNSLEKIDHKNSIKCKNRESQDPQP